MMRTVLLSMVLLAGLATLNGCDGSNQPDQVGSGAGQTNNTGAPSGRVTTQGEAERTGAQ